MKERNSARALASLMLLLSAVPVASQEEAVAPKEVRLEQRERPRAVPMILHLTNGSTLRVRAVLVGDNWEIKQSKGYAKVATGMVERAERESDLRKQARDLERASSKKEPTRRAAYAAWLASEGLKQESLKEIDRLLKEDPESKAARAVLARQNFSLNLPELAQDSSTQDVHGWIGAALRWGPAGLELAAQQLCQLRPTPEIQRGLLEDLVSHNASRRSFSALCLRRALTGQHGQALLRRAILDPSETVRDSASLALAAFEEPDRMVQTVALSLGSKSAKVRMNAASSLASMGYRSAVPSLMSQLNNLQSREGRKPRAHFYSGNQQAYVQDFDVEVASNSSIADPVINVLTDGMVLDVAVLGTSQRTIIQERATIRRALSKLTGATPGNSTKQWMQWWDLNRASYQLNRDDGPERTTSRAL